MKTSTQNEVGAQKRKPAHEHGARRERRRRRGTELAVSLAQGVAGVTAGVAPEGWSPGKNWTCRGIRYLGRKFHRAVGRIRGEKANTKIEHR